MKTITFKEFGNDFKKFYNCDKAEIRTEEEAEIIFWDLYECKEYEFDYDNKTIDLYF